MSKLRFVHDCDASVAPIFALLLVVLVGATGAAIDYSRASSARSAILNALDATGLMLAKEAEGLAQADLTAKANTYFLANLYGPAAKDLTLTPELSSPQPGTYNLRLTATGTLDGTLTKVVGQSQFDLGASAEFTWGIKKLELALVLDNTGSMAQSNKIGELKTASHNLLNTLEQAAKQPGDIKVAIIPFDTKVNIGTSYKDEPWIDFTVKNINKNQWNGCVIDRDQSHDVLDTTPTTSNYHTLFPAANCGSLVTVLPLTENWSTLHSKVDAMTAAGNTNTTIGMVWGWHALTHNLPLTGAAEPASDLDKVIVLLTDGDNTQNRWTTSNSAIDARMALACTNAKAANIKVYTIRVINGDANLLRNCATKPDMYYDVQNAGQLSSTFKSIAQSLASLRVAK